MKKPCLLFVYNADSSALAQLIDLAHKTVSPKTYQCNLCGLTYKGVSMRQEWKEFLNTLPCPAHFLHKDEFAEKFPKYALTAYPAVFTINGTLLQELISADDINKQNTLEDLKNLVKQRLRS